MADYDQVNIDEDVEASLELHPKSNKTALDALSKRTYRGYHMRKKLATLVIFIAIIVVVQFFVRGKVDSDSSSSSELSKGPDTVEKYTFHDAPQTPKSPPPPPPPKQTTPEASTPPPPTETAPPVPQAPEVVGTLTDMAAKGRKLNIATWNIAAINNNPFEYWITTDDPNYSKLMQDIEEFLENPGDRDVPVSEVFTDEMFTQLWNEFPPPIKHEEIPGYWKNDYRNRRIVSEFMQDDELGAKRLISMPDRVSNSIEVVGSRELVVRPTIINAYQKDLSSVQKWFEAWKFFMFTFPIPSTNSEGSFIGFPWVYTFIPMISKAKYPAITAEEERISRGLEVICLGIFDAILVHMMNTVSTPDVWQPIKRTLVDKLIRNKETNTIKILKNTYIDSDIITLQEASQDFAHTAGSELGSDFFIVTPKGVDPNRRQNSMIFLNKKTFPNGAFREVTPVVANSFPEGVDIPIAPGDAIAIEAYDVDNIPYLIASFHGDTNGQATIPILNAIYTSVQNYPEFQNHQIIFGLDANTYEHGEPGKKQDVLEFAERYVSMGLTSCWGDTPNPANYTTFNARTYLQPQLNKACKSTEKRECGDINPKDFILFFAKSFDVERTLKDNTGNKEYIEDMTFPTLDFPSDHGILSTVLTPKQN